MVRVTSFPLSTFAFGLWRLGHASLLMRFRGGPTVAVDPYLTDAAAAAWPRMRRRFPPPFPPAALDADLVLVTHTHADHLDLETLRPSPAFARARFAGPGSVCAALAALGVPADRLTRLEAGERWEGLGIAVTATRAWHSPDVPDAVGFSIAPVDGGPRVLVTGDTVFHEGLHPSERPDVLVLPINGKLGNMGVEGAARLAVELQPRWAVPAHYDLIAANGEDPEAFLLHMELKGLGDHAGVLGVMQPLLLAADGTGTRVTRQLEMVWDCGRPVREIALPAGYRMRPFREEMIPGLGMIYAKAFGPGHDAAWWRREFLESPMFDPERVIVVEHGGAPVATAIAWENDHHRGLSQGILHWVAADPAHHRRGLGKAVSAAVQAWFKRAGRRGVYLQTDDDRVPAIRAYLALGFEPVVTDGESRLRWENLRAGMAVA